MAYTKLDHGITESTIWYEPDATRLVWITMLSMADQFGYVGASIPGLAGKARVSLEDCLAALDKFAAPDEYSRTKDHEGRRIAEADGGWVLLNHAKYLAKQSEDDRRERARVAMQRLRARRKQPLAPVSTGEGELASLAHEDVALHVAKEQELSTSLRAVDAGFLESDPPVSDKPKRQKRAQVPIAAIVDLYHEKLPMLPRCEKLTTTRAGYIRQRWLEDLPDLDQWANYFAYVAQSPFLTGRAKPQGDRPPFRADIEWLTNPTNFAKIAEEKYHRA